MTAPFRPGLAALGSLNIEDLHATPGAAAAAASQALQHDPANRGLHLVDASYAALAAGEPKRALRLLDEIGTGDPGLSRHAAALRVWARQLDRNWYPGGIGAETVDEHAPTVTPAPGAPETELIEQLIANGPPGLAPTRAICADLARTGNGPALLQLTAQGMQGLQTLAVASARLQALGIAAWCEIAAADLAQRSGHTAAAELMGQARATATRFGLTGVVALSHLIEGDWYATPQSCPEALGFDLPARQRPNTSPRDLRRAQECYAAGAAYAAGLPLPRLHAALDLRWATLAWLTGNHEERRRRLLAAHDLYGRAGDAAGFHLSAVHLVIADLAEGRLYRHVLALGSGWRPPEHGPIADLLAWTRTDGSSAWCAGLGRLLQRAAEWWQAEGSVPQAQAAYLAALPLLAADPALPVQTIVTAVAYLDARRNLAARALTRMERLLNTTPPAQPGPPSHIDFAQRLETVLAMVEAQRVRIDSAAAEHAARGMLRLRAHLDEMLALPGIADLAGPAEIDPDAVLAAAAQDPDANVDDLYESLLGGEMMRRMLAAAADVARWQRASLDVLIPLARGGHAHRLGLLERADGCYAEALEAAGRPAAPAYLRPLVLIATQDQAGARAELERLERDQQLPDDQLAALAQRAEDPERATRAFLRSGGPERARRDWQDALTAAELALDGGDPHEAIRWAQHGAGLIEQSVASLLRDPERIAGCDRSGIVRLFLTQAKAFDTLAQTQPGEAVALRGRSFAAAERARSLTLLPDPAGGSGAAAWRAWQQLAAEWTISADRLVAAIDTPDAGDTSALVDAVDAADARLAAAEYELDRSQPGGLLRRSAPPPPFPVGELQARLAPGTVVIEYLAMDQDLLRWTVSRDRITVHRRRFSGRRLAALVRGFHTSCATGSGQGPEARELAELLLGGAEQVLAEHSRVVVVPFGPLNLVPFHALPVHAVALGAEHVLSYLPSATALTRTDTVLDAPLRPRRPLIVGDPSFDPAARPGLERLAGAVVEARAAARILRCPADDVLIGAAATEPAVRDRLAGHDLLHLCTHGTLDELAPFASSLVLADGDELTVADLAGLDVHAELAILSACDTGRGTATLGGDVVGLTRALIRAGIRRTLVSLWPVDDEVAPVTICRFLDRLTQGEAPAYALANAQRFVAGLDHDGLRREYEALGGTVGERATRRGNPLDHELLDLEEEPAPLGGDAERFWAPFILVGA